MTTGSWVAAPPAVVHDDGIADFDFASSQHECAGKSCYDVLNWRERY
jgi:hypothetical protein